LTWLVHAPAVTNTTSGNMSTSLLLLLLLLLLLQPHLPQGLLHIIPAEAAAPGPAALSIHHMQLAAGHHCSGSSDAPALKGLKM
jgi:hypothetical protein